MVGDLDTIHARKTQPNAIAVVSGFSQCPTATIACKHDGFLTKDRDLNDAHLILAASAFRWEMLVIPGSRNQRGSLLGARLQKPPQLVTGRGLGLGDAFRRVVGIDDQVEVAGATRCQYMEVADVYTLEWIANWNSLPLGDLLELGQARIDSAQPGPQTGGIVIRRETRQELIRIDLRAQHPKFAHFHIVEDVSKSTRMVAIAMRDH